MYGCNQFFKTVNVEQFNKNLLDGDRRHVTRVRYDKHVDTTQMFNAQLHITSQHITVKLPNS